MRIQLDSTNISADTARVASAAQAGAHAISRTADRQVAGADSIGISGTSAALSRLSGERSDRIQQLTASFKAGSYSIPSAALSSAIVSQAFAQ